MGLKIKHKTFIHVLNKILNASVIRAEHKAKFLHGGTVGNIYISFDRFAGSVHPIAALRSNIHPDEASARLRYNY